jgi:hypothetical protein
VTPTRSPFAIRRASILIVAILVIAPLSAAHAEDPWNQEIVLSVAENLETSIKDLRAIARQATAQSQRRQDRLIKLASEELRKLQNATRQLVKALKAGKGRDETLSIIKRIDLHRNETAIFARRAAVSVETQAKLAAANGLVKELEYYYYTTDVGGDDLAGEEE